MSELMIPKQETGPAEILEIAQKIPAPVGSIDWESADLDEWARHKPSPIECLFTGIFPRGIVAGLGGSGGVGKSTFVLALAISLAVGMTLFPFLVPEQPEPVMVFMGEDPEMITRRRFWNIVRRFQLDDEQRARLVHNLKLYPHTAAPLCMLQDGALVTTAHYQWLAEQVRIFRPALVILDPKARWAAINENSNDDATRFVSLLEDMVRPHGGSLLLTHHVAKGQRKNLDANSARGASAFPDATRLFMNMVTVDKDGGDETEEGVQEVLFHVTKNNFAPRLPKPVVLRHNAEFGGVLEQAPNQEDANVTAIAESLAEWLQENGSLNVSAIRIPRNEGEKALRSFLKERCGSYHRHIDRAIQLGEQLGLLRTETVGTGGRSAQRVHAVVEA